MHPVVVTGNNVELKIEQHAEQKLLVDALVIQQGRLSNQQRCVSTAGSGKELLDMIRFGVEQIVATNNRTLEKTITNINTLVKTSEDCIVSHTEKVCLQGMATMHRFDTGNQGKNAIDATKEVCGCNNNNNDLQDDDSGIGIQ